MSSRKKMELRLAALQAEALRLGTDKNLLFGNKTYKELESIIDENYKKITNNNNSDEKKKEEMKS